MVRFQPLYCSLPSDGMYFFRLYHRNVQSYYPTQIQQMNFSIHQFCTIAFIQTVLFGIVFALLGGLLSFLATTAFFFCNAIGWIVLVRLLINASVSERMSPVIALLCVGKVLALFCFLWLILQYVSTTTLVLSNSLIAFSLLAGCTNYIPKLEFSNGN